MIEGDAQILQHFIENWERELIDYISKLESAIISRRILPVRKVGEDIGIDEVMTYDRTGSGARIVAKGSPPSGSGSVASHVPHIMYQLLDGFNIHEKDLKLDPKAKQRDIEIVTDNIHRAENILAVRGDTEHNLPGVTTDIPAGNSLFTLGKWDGTASAVKYYHDILRLSKTIDPDYQLKFLVGNQTDLLELFNLSAQQETPVWKQIAPLFGHTEMEDPRKTWMVMCGDLTLPAGKVYAIPHDKRAAELVISENPTLRSIAQQPGGNYPIELFEWLTTEKHAVDAFAELNVAAES